MNISTFAQYLKSALYTGCFLTVFTALQAQPLQYELFSSEFGLSQNMVNQMVQDRKGFLWVATNDGLNRFDGYRFITYSFDPFDSLSLAENRIVSLLEDKFGRFWVATERHIHLFDREKEVFYRLKNPSSDGILTEDPAGNLWRGRMKEGLMCIVLPPGEKRLDQAKVYVDKSLQGQVVYTPHWGKSGSGLTHDEAFRTYSVQFDRATQTILTNKNLEHLKNTPAFPYLNNTDPKIKYHSVYDKNGTHWLILKEQLMGWNSQTSQHTTLHVPPQFQYDRTDQANVLGFISAIETDRQGRLWLGGYGGSFQVDLKRKLVRNITPKDQTDPLHYGINTILEDQSGLIWIGTRGKGLLKFNDNARRFSNGLWRGESIRCLYQSSDGYVWLSFMRGGLFRWDPKTQLIQQLFAQKKHKDNDIGMVLSFCEDKNGVLWIGATNWGLIKLTNWQQGRMPEMKIFAIDPIFKWNDNAPNKIIEDMEGSLWMASPDGLRRFNPANATFETYPFFPDNSLQKIQLNHFPTLFTNRKGQIWVGMGGEGLWEFDRSGKQFIQYRNDPKNPRSISSDVIKSIAEDPVQPERFLYIGTGGGGLNRLDTETGVFEKFTEKDGLPNMVVYGILPDNAGFLWLSTNRGLSVFDPQKRSFRNFDPRDGLQNLEFNSLAYAKAANGTLLFGGIEGFNTFNPANVLQKNGHVPSIVFTDFKISNQSVSHKTPGSPLKEAIAYTQKITLSPEVKIISFEFAALDFADPLKNEFACKMEGFDPDWQMLGTTHAATYTNLNPGTYTFKVRGSNNNGVWNEAGVSIEIEILSPWWATWWAKLLYLMVVSGVIYAFYQLQVKRNQAKAEARRLLDLNTAKSQFLSTVSHEFRTPLTSIMGFSKIIQKRFEERILPNLDQKDPKVARAATQLSSNLDIVVSESERLTALINDVLDLSRIESGKMVWHEEKIDVAQIIEHAIMATNTLFESKGLQVLHQTAPDLPMTMADSNRILQVMVNLLSNAAKFTEQGHITCSTRLEGPNTILVSVADTGVGVPEAFRGAIFEKFKQATSDTLTDKPQGTGLGLAICKDIVEYHGGRIWLESAAGGGSVFSFTLPVR